MPDISSLVKKTTTTKKKTTEYNTEINKIENKVTDHNHNKYITTPEFNKLTP